MSSLRAYDIDPDDPRAPSEEIWARLSPAERARVVDQLPSEFPVDEASPPEGDVHYRAVRSVRDALQGYFRRLRQRIYIGSNLPIYYPGERMFSVDALAVLDVEDGPRNSWVVSREGRGLDFALEIHWLGHRLKDFDRNVKWFARLGIQEYFVFDVRRLSIQGFHLQPEGGREYVPIIPQGGRYGSKVLGLELGVEGTHLRFYAGSAPLPDADDLIERLDSALTDARRRAEDEARRAEDEAKRADEESRRATAAESALKEALLELERLKHQR